MYVFSKNHSTGLSNLHDSGTSDLISSRWSLATLDASTTTIFTSSSIVVYIHIFVVVYDKHEIQQWGASWARNSTWRIWKQQRKSLAWRYTETKKVVTLPKQVHWESAEETQHERSKPVITPIPGHIKLSLQLCPKSDKVKEYICPECSMKVQWTTRAIMCSRSYLFVVSLVSMFVSNPGKLQRETVKWIP